MKSKKRIGMILDRDFPPDDRPEKEALSLIEAGYEVHLLCYTAKGRPLKENYKGIRIARFNLKEKLHKKLSAAYLVLPLYRIIWYRNMKEFILGNDINVIHVHDLPMTDIAHKLGKKYECKVVCDQHEYWSNWIGKTYHYNTIIGKLVKTFSNWKKYEKINLQKADLVITVSEQLRRLYIQDVGLKPKKIITVPNTPSRKVFNEQNVNPEIIKKYEQKFCIFYAGAIDVLRGIDLIIYAMAKLMDKIPDIYFILAGRFAKGCNILQLAEFLGIRSQVEYVGWLPVDQLPSYIAASKLCVYTPPAETSDEVNNTIHTKIYQYVSMKKPIIISKVKMMHDFVIDNDVGLSIDRQIPELLADKIEFIYKNYSKVQDKIEKNASFLISNGEIFWDQTVVKMIVQYNNII